MPEMEAWSALFWHFYDSNSFFQVSAIEICLYQNFRATQNEQIFFAYDSRNAWALPNGNTLQPFGQASSVSKTFEVGVPL